MIELNQFFLQNYNLFHYPKLQPDDKNEVGLVNNLFKVINVENWTTEWNVCVCSFKISQPHLYHSAATAAKSLQSCPTLCDPIEGSPPGSLIPGILQARTLEWVAISFSNAWKWKVKVKSLSHVWLFATPWTAAHQAPPSMGLPRQEYWSGVPLPSPISLYLWSKTLKLNNFCIFFILFKFKFIYINAFWITRPVKLLVILYKQ